MPNFSGFEICSPTDDAQGISAGFIQFTTCSGSAETVCQEYQRLQSNTFCDKYMDSLDKAVGLDSCNGNTGRYIPDGLSSFCVAWKDAALRDPVFRQAQLNVQFSSYFSPVTNLFSKYNLKTPLAMGALYDIAIQLGPHDAAMLAASATKAAGGSPASVRPVPEKRWLFSLLLQRSRYLEYKSGAYALTQYRVQAYLSMINNPNFDNDQILMTDRGTTMTVGCN
ncbi:UNVERIFIED_CONTAM: hypothetical protein HDU68_008954 [Siphonaria sp. JEL0065]|nr:hypothetical protein HDU68_008954 [Siphonaria sp. JEL0065]